MKTIEFIVRDQKYNLANGWDQLSPAQYEALISDVDQMTTGKLSPAMVRINYVCRAMGWNKRKIKGEDSFANLAWIAEQVTFPFIIVYPDNDAALSDLDAETRAKYKRIPPERMQGHALSRYLCKLDYKFVLDSCFCAQLVPFVKIGTVLYPGYKVDTSFDVLTCSLTALQYIEARALIGATSDKLPLLAAILYHPQPYESISAHELAQSFSKLPIATLQAIAFNFQAFNNYLLTQTPFALLTEGEAGEAKAISTGALESLYNLSGDGHGDVEQMNVIKYLTIIRKKLIESVRSLHAAGLDKAKISTETGFPISTIAKII